MNWVQSIYTLTFGGFLLVGARLGDLLGRRQTYLMGLALFSLASVAVGVSQGPIGMIVARAVQAVGAAILATTTLSLLAISIPEGPERDRATTWYGSTAGIGA